MQKDSLVALNITYNNTLLNPTNVPILFYWDGVGNLFDCIIKDPKFTDIIKEKCFNFEMFSKSKITCFYFKDDTEEYTEFESDIQDILDINSELSYEFMIKICLKLYKVSMKSEFNNFNKLENDELIKDIYLQIKSKYKKKFNNESFLNYVRSELQTQYNINNHNSDIIINTYLKKIVYEQ